MISPFFVLIRKDLMVEARGKGMITISLFLTILLSVVMTIGIQSAFLPPATILRLFPGLLWAIFLISATISCERSFDAEIEHRAIDGLLLSGISPTWLYSSKVFSLCILQLIGFAVSLTALTVLLNVPFLFPIFSLIPIVILVVFGVSCILTIASGMTSSAKLRSSLLPLITLPILIPLFFGAIELFAQMMDGQPITLQTPWVLFLIGFDLVYASVGILLYRYVW